MNCSNQDPAACFNSVSLVLEHIVVDSLLGTERKSPKAHEQGLNHQRPQEPVICLE